MKKSARILVIDDEAPIRHILKTTLAAEGFEVESASNGEEAIELATANQFDLIIIDLIMPRKDGFETIVALHEIRPDVGIIVMSGGGWKAAPANYLRVAAKLGNCRTLAKPFGRSDLMAAIEEQIGKGE